MQAHVKWGRKLLNNLAYCTCVLCFPFFKEVFGRCVGILRWIEPYAVIFYVTVN